MKAKLKSAAKTLLKNVLGAEFLYNNVGQLRSALADCKTIVDLGCGLDSPYFRYMHKAGDHVIGVDAYASPRAREACDEFFAIDALEFLKSQADSSFDAVMALDVIEHMPKAQSVEFLDNMIRVARKSVIVVTPNGLWPGMIKGPGMDHLCGWDADELAHRGFKCWGNGGLAALRSKKHSFLKGFPSTKTLLLQLFVFNAAQPFVRNNPKRAYGLTAVLKKAA